MAASRASSFPTICIRTTITPIPLFVGRIVTHRTFGFRKKNYIRKKGTLNTLKHISDYVRSIFYRTTLHYVFVDRNALPANRRNCAHGIVLFASSLHTLSVNLECYHGSFLCYAPTSSQKHSDSTAEKQQTSTRNSGSACPSGDRIQQEPNTHCGYQRAHCFRH